MKLMIRHSTGVAGLYDFGPSGCAMEANMLTIWKSHFVLEEQMLEIRASLLTPHQVLKWVIQSHVVIIVHRWVCNSSLQVIWELRQGRHQQRECHLKMEFCISVIILILSHLPHKMYTILKLNLYEQLGEKIDIYFSNNLTSRIIIALKHWGKL